MTQSKNDDWGKPSSPAWNMPHTDGDYEVGYKKPPKHSRWRPGQSGHPGGRPKRSDTVHERVQAQLDRKVTAANGQSMTVKEVILSTAIAGLMGKGARSVKTSIEMIRFLETFDTKVDFVPTVADEQRLNALLAKLKLEPNNE